MSFATHRRWYWQYLVRSIRGIQVKRKTYDILQGNGNISYSDMEKHVWTVYDQFKGKGKQIESEEADAEDLKWLDDLQNKMKNKE